LLRLAALEGQVFMPNTEFGGFAGVSYYLGDINARWHFYAPDLAFGFLAKHNFTEHHSLRGNVNFANIKGNDKDFSNDYQKTRAASFATSLLDFNLGYEFNFSPQIIDRRPRKYTLFTFAGVGYSLIVSSTSQAASNHLTIPFGLGYKYRINKRLIVGIEWSMRKTFVDDLDGLFKPGTDIYNPSKKLHNNDWYSYAGVFFTVRAFEKRHICRGVPEERKFK
jgi:hypothetical protein